MRIIGRFLGFLFSTLAILFLIGAAVGIALYFYFEQDLPDTTQLQSYEPPVLTRVHAADGSLLAEYSHERRLYLPSADIPPLVKQAFISAEDKNFYMHNGVDPEGILRAAMILVAGGHHMQGASTITQQVAKNFLVGDERSFVRKAKEAILALRIEHAYSKDHILELYLNKIFFGLGNYGVAAAALNYFDKSVNELTIAEAAYLAALPKGPNNYNPFRNRDAAIQRRNYVIDRMVENGYISRADGDKAMREPLNVKLRVLTPDTYVAGYFAEEVRRELLARYGEQKVYEGGLSVHTTLDPAMQQLARKSLVDGLIRFDEAHGWRGPVTHIDIGNDWGPPLAAVPGLGDVPGWRLAVVLDSSNDQAMRIGMQPKYEKSGDVGPEREIGLVPPDGAKWTNQKFRTLAGPGDVVYVEALPGKPGQWRLRQVPEISGAIVAMDPHTGRVLAMVGGFSYDQSEFNRATQALRQPGSSFKPFVYAAALDGNGTMPSGTPFNPTSLIENGPITIDQGNGELWTPKNFEEGEAAGSHPLRWGVEHSMNLMTVRLAQAVGMPVIVEYAKRFGVYDDLMPVLSMSLGAGETTVMRMVTAYSMFDNGGQRIQATLIDRIQDRTGKTIFRHDERICKGCDADAWHDQPEPRLVVKPDQVIDPATAYQITSILEGVIQRGTGVSISVLHRHLAGKTGTTNDAKDLWFVGFSTDLCVGLYLGYDRPRSMGGSAQAATYAAPIFRDFMAQALKDKPDVPFRVPRGIHLMPIGNGIIEAFKDDEYPDNGEVLGGESAAAAGAGGATPDADRAVGPGTGGLY
ncbi:penicillin-binding protein 1A [Methylovirgula sp. 4M-Z18]|uniref:penicillin-binding protein 1A n=1 Tax=Methylovirgula sp. 4M-Z18 TaxID=2293567 RepID=UPI000E2EC687|nr:penicillin-binding protein 1A [Methylovirgula sp. 4M-Z18]RFB80804.1 penicillin-binding protein 1A [Methylovirgula sp. 4M-Z18]